MAMLYYILLTLLCVPVLSQRHCILYAIQGMENSPHCSRDTTLRPIPVFTSVPDLPTSGIPYTQESSNSLDFEYFGLIALVVLIYIFYVLYLHFVRFLPWVDALGHAFIHLAAFYRGAADRGEARPEIICCHHVYLLCVKTNVVAQSLRPASPTGVAVTDEDTPL
jgi:hypothetical protein